MATLETYQTLRDKRGFAPNTQISHTANMVEVRLYGNLIARLWANGDVWLSDAGWPTQTTARRLRALVPDGHTIYVANGHTWLGRRDGPPIPLDGGALICGGGQ